GAARGALVDERAQPRHVDELGVLDALAEGARRGDDGILEAETACGLDLEVDAVLGQRLAPRRREVRVGEALSVDRDGGRGRLAFGLARRCLDDRGAVERRELDAVTLVLALARDLEALLSRGAFLALTLLDPPRSSPRHQAISASADAAMPTVAGSPASKRTSPSANTGPSRQTRALPCAVTMTHARHTPIAH